MFDLDREVNHWCRKMRPSFFCSRNQIDELEDHLHCAISQRIALGETSEEAFQHSIAQLGESSSLLAEYRKNWSLLTTTFVRFESGGSRFCNSIGLKRRYLLYSATALFLGCLAGISHRILQDVSVIQWTQSTLVAIYSFPFNLLGAS